MKIRPIRVLAVTNMYPTPVDTVYGCFVASQIESVRRAGVDVQVEFIDGRRNRFHYGLGIQKVRRLALSGRFDLVHAHYGLTGFVASFQPLPLVVSFCGDDLLGTPARKGGLTSKSRVVRALSHVAARCAHGIICKSDELRAALPRVVDRERAHVLPNGVDISRFSPGDRSVARARLGLKADETVVIFPGTPNERRKRLDLAQAAIRELAVRGIMAKLWVVTGVPHGEMPDYYRAADALLLTSDWEGSPNVVKEALCCNLPVVSVEAGDVRRWFGLVTGCVLVERRPSAIAEGLRRVLVSSKQIDGSNVRNELDSARIAGDIIRVYKEIIVRHQRLSDQRAGKRAAEPNRPFSVE